MRNLPPYPFKRFQPTDFRFQIEIRRILSFTGKVFSDTRAALLALCFPYPCAGCGEMLKYPDVICDSCASRLPRIHDPCCAICGYPFPAQWLVAVCPECRIRRPALTRIRSAFEYDGVLMQLIRELKFSRRARCLRFFAGELYVKMMSDFPRAVSAIVPVPLHPSREWERTFNQSGILAQELSEISGVPVRSILKRCKLTKPQTALSGQARRRNLEGAFQAAFNSRDVPRSVILLDDVITTGATLEACAVELRKAGVRRIYGLTIARALLKV